MTNHRYSVRDWQVVDGDTVRLTVDLGFRLAFTDAFRLARVNTPERQAGKVASIALEKKLHVEGGSPLEVATFKTEKYGRWLAELWAGDLNINDWLLAEGLGQPYDGGKRP